MKYYKLSFINEGLAYILIRYKRLQATDKQMPRITFKTTLIIVEPLINAKEKDDIAEMIERTIDEAMKDVMSKLGIREYDILQGETHQHLQPRKPGVRYRHGRHPS